MFGVVPRTLWEQRVSPDDRNRIPLVARPMLLRSSDRTILVDTGIGGRWTEKERGIYAIERADDGIVSALSELGVSRSDVTDVLFTHLHFDHAGATTVERNGNVELTFPEATHHVHRENWNWAQNPTERDQASYRKKDMDPLEERGDLKLLDGNTEFLPGIDCIQVDGHTRGLQMVRVSGKEKDLVYVTDLIPTSNHLPLPFIMGYDLWPLQTLEERKNLYRESAGQQLLFAFEHDPEVTACSLNHDREHPEIDQVFV